MKYFIRYQGMWWRPDSCGYTNNILEAGLYDEDKARRQQRCNRGDEAVPADAERATMVREAWARLNSEVLIELLAPPGSPPLILVPSSLPISIAAIADEDPEQRAADVVEAQRLARLAP